MDPLTINPLYLLTLPFAAWPGIQGISDFAEPSWHFILLSRSSATPSWA